MAMKSADQVAQKWATRIAGSTQDYVNGVNAVTTAPGEQAAKAIDRMIQKLIEMHQSGELAKRMKSVSLDEWKKAAIEKGSTRLASGATAAQPKMEKFLGQFLSYLESKKGQLPERGTKEQNKARMLKQFEINSSFKYDK